MMLSFDRYEKRRAGTSKAWYSLLHSCFDATVVVVADPSRIAQKESQIMLYHGLVQTEEGCL